MRIRALTCVAALAALPALAQEAALGIDLIPGHPVYHGRENEAGVAMALSITPDQDRATRLMELCEELRVAAGLGHESGDELRLETIFVVPYKGMAVEGLYLPRDGTVGSFEATPSRGRRSMASCRARAFRRASSTRRMSSMRSRARLASRCGSSPGTTSGASVTRRRKR